MIMVKLERYESKFSHRFNSSKIIKSKTDEDNKGNTIISEGIDVLFRHVKLLVFTLIKLNNPL